jgi:hypothetical protein
MGDNSILQNFIQMRRSLHKEEKKPAASRKKGTSAAMVTNATEDTLAKILEEKPGKKVLIEYFQKECSRLTAEKMK